MDLLEHVAHTILRLYTYQLKRIIALQIHNLSLLNPQSSVLEKAIFSHLLTKSVHKNPQIRRLMTIIFKANQNKIQRSEDSLQQQELQFCAKLQTKKIIIEIIRQILQEKKNPSLPKPVKQQEFQGKFKNVIQVEQSINIEMMVQESSVNKQMKDFQSRDKPENHLESSSKLCSSVRDKQDNHDIDQFQEQTCQSGHFLFGDKLKKIEQVFLVEDEMFGLVSWEARMNKEIPKESILGIGIIRQHRPRQLCSFLQAYLNNLKPKSA